MSRPVSASTPERCRDLWHPRWSRAALALGWVAVLAADPPATLGVTATANVYIEKSRDLSIVNRSTVAVRVTTVPSGGWTVLPVEPVVLGVGESVVLQVAGTGEDGARIAIHVRASDSALQGGESAEIVLGARVYLVAPAPTTMSPWLVVLVVAACAATVGLTLRYLRLGARPASGHHGHATA
jgi:hypothetical protein